jgi:phage tail protein X
MATIFSYTTIQGDAFDSISWDLFRTEKYTGSIMAANPTFVDVINFDAGIVLTIPVVPSAPNLSNVDWGQLISTSA